MAAIVQTQYQAQDTSAARAFWITGTLCTLALLIGDLKKVKKP